MYEIYGSDLIVREKNNIFESAEKLAQVILKGKNILEGRIYTLSHSLTSKTYSVSETHYVGFVHKCE